MVKVGNKLLAVISVFAFATVLIVSLTSCTSSNNASDDIAPVSRDVDKSSFTGEHGSEIYDLYKNTKNQKAAKLLSDGDFSEQDFHDVRDMYISCMHKLGYEVAFEKHEGGPDRESIKMPGDFSTDDKIADEQSQKELNAEMKCWQETDYSNFEMVYNAIHYPNGSTVYATDEQRVSCLKEEKLAPEDYTVDEFKYDFGGTDEKKHGIVDKYSNSDKSPSKEDSDTFLKCVNNPNG
ncbi:MAG: hypothetical protein LBI63_05725 [Candidatus Ancillula sp.]|jgi:hypothetical protein|nr:hypothetical protein [Candidatus Ancillula sp.]